MSGNPGHPPRVLTMPPCTTWPEYIQDQSIVHGDDRGMGAPAHGKLVQNGISVRPDGAVAPSGTERTPFTEDAERSSLFARR